MSKISDLLLIKKTLDGDTNAFGVLVNRHQDYIFNVIIKMLRNREEAEEIAQDTFIKAYEVLVSFKGEAKFSTWLFKIAYRKALDRIKKNKRSATLELVENLTEDASMDFESGLAIMLMEERKEIIKNCILKLPEIEAAIITLYYYEDQSVKEIADITNLSQDNIKVKLHRSRKLLYSFLENHIHPKIFSENGKA
ncbi:RNA polymerase ECF family sigma subunit [Gillisia mitskevichiae]|uniref:RNA polymerase sigma factor n=1 Tax=Gillisia mitskevichiae TaxID=270921 RepID=A0A495P571_9FLAO|nr:RNA polymerase sigma factor [Gillisia mitskevichiae]RKS45106.1 RNA polymerase ECF family sigma subunit [Gillisia mitskevichiae]